MTAPASQPLPSDNRLEADVEIERYADQGRCVAHLDGRVVFVRFALPGERVHILVDEPHNRKDRFWTAEVTEVLKASPDRVEPVWPLAGPLAWGGGVGGADLVHVSLPGQLAWKKAVIEDQMRRLGHVEVSVPVHRLPEDEAEGGLHWRTRLDLVADEEGHPSMRRRESHQRVALTDMPTASQRLLGVAAAEDLWNHRFDPNDHIRISVPEPRSLAGEAKDGKDNEDNYAIVLNGKVISGRRNLSERVLLSNPALPGDDGSHTQFDSFDSFDYTVDAEGFWQVHRCAPTVLAQAVVNALMASGADQASTLWDLYSGSGLFTLPMATFFPQAQVLSIEGAPVAVKNAHKNIKQARLNKTITALEGDVAETIRSLTAHGHAQLTKPDVILLDPPRAGAGRKVCQQMAESGAKTIVYVSCDVTNLARDTAYLTEAGYHISDIQAYDIYPMTHHVETVCLMSKV
ncbi:MAG: class I SAM-dependent RNA methyltransferase [Parascardovia denticolens]